MGRFVLYIAKFRSTTDINVTTYSTHFKGYIGIGHRTKKLISIGTNSSSVGTYTMAYTESNKGHIKALYMYLVSDSGNRKEGRKCFI